jgi:hypothetical protein
MAIVAVNGGGNTPIGDVTDGTSNTIMAGESPAKVELVPIVGDWNGDGRDSVGSPGDYAGSHLLYQDVVVPLDNPYVLTRTEHAATDTSYAELQGYSFLFEGNSQALDDDAGIAWVSGKGGIRGADTVPESDWLLV